MTIGRNGPGIRHRDHPVGGSEPFHATAKAMKERVGVVDAPIMLFRATEPNRYDGTGFAWPDLAHSLLRPKEV